MATRLLCCVALCLLGVEPADVGVSQSPRHKVTEVRQEVTLRCQPIAGHAALYWYKQTSGQGLEFLIYFNNRDPVDESGMPKGRFSAEMPSASLSMLKIQSAEPGDSATYLCASSTGTAPQSHPLSVQEVPASPARSSPGRPRPQRWVQALPSQHRDWVWGSAVLREGEKRITT
uniref:Ig-like domain-containing protein n=1 Tax=Catagonus wagneri TaxID=51154 RepID=A0A8C3YMX8_9CETA